MRSAWRNATAHRPSGLDGTRHNGSMASEVVFEWRGAVADEELSILHASAFAHEPVTEGWSRRLERHALGWVTARQDATLVGFVNVVGDGGRHAFLLDTMVRPDRRGGGIGRALVSRAIEECLLAGAEWLHVDFEPELSGFYLRPDAFRSTSAGLLHLTDVR
jgi:GNAT superfamily N-acetyltransferase